jgi:hypothetical protein
VLPPVSVRQFAKLEGCSHTLVQRAIKEGRLRASADGKLDPALVGTGWRRGNIIAACAATPIATVATVKVATAPSEPSVASAARAEEELFAEEAESFLANVLAGKFTDMATAMKVKENALAAKNLLAARRDAGSLVEIEQAEMVLFDTQRSQRDAWINFPTKIGPLLAAELGLEADKVVEALTAHVHQQLDDLGEPEADFAARHEG